MSLLDPLLGVANTSETLASSSTSGAGGSVLLVAPALLRKYTGKFELMACISATTPGGGTQGIAMQLVSSLVGNVGPAMSYYGTSAAGSVVWIDYAVIDVGQSIQYSLKVSPVSGSNSISIAAGAGGLSVVER